MSSDKLRKELREKAKKISENQQKVNDAQAIIDFMPSIPKLLTFDPEGLNLTLTSHNKLPEDISEWAINLTIKNMSEIYQKSWQWDEETKQEEILNRNARYLVAYKGDDDPVGYIHFRFEQLDGDFVIYIYDVQTEQSVRNSGLSKFLIQAVELIGLKIGVQACVTFVFKEDKEYMAILNGLNYQFHHTSPSVYCPDKPEKYKHEILFKPLTKTN
ncbi:MGC78821 protein, putative [Trichomonas vaginalis G3]|uniref:N-alpha-acetyltransferase 40 n=1 Tax=Trichomonas vaginalis (strain ATCC PRA-98 / G3) TaxID=412133 RepID=A2FUN4_TRIV3|nr:H2A histone acetyltransferase protein [Trichomonas vaginalis G3]EAX91382.1 MGC78821 protein, putative [Trichomonas vaginalis G3]KAI5483608.1 H2A histone acetyltransferase protein [Trichomonas vaginalis G3]|eukprot:XP_001304312.1 MGC78821 protein [Trichomonas vaginalis G3]